MLCCSLDELYIVLWSVSPELLLILFLPNLGHFQPLFLQVHCWLHPLFPPSWDCRRTVWTLHLLLPSHRALRLRSFFSAYFFLLSGQVTFVILWFFSVTCSFCLFLLLLFILPLSPTIMSFVSVIVLLSSQVSICFFVMSSFSFLRVSVFRLSQGCVKLLVRAFLWWLL